MARNNKKQNTLPEGRPLIPKTKGQENFIRTVVENELTICTGFAGTGKTHLSIGLACSYLLEKKVDKIIVVRPQIQCGSIGHLPGDIDAKAKPFTKVLTDAFKYFLGPVRMQTYIDNKTIDIDYIETMRGDNFHNAFIILDEFQNLTYAQLEMFATRMGENSKCVISGDLRQSDLNNHRFNNSEDIKNRFINKLVGAPGIGYCSLGIDDIVRSGIARTIILRLNE